MKFLDLGKGHDLIELAIDFLLSHAENRAVQIRVFAAGQLRVKTGAHFEQAAHAAMDFRAADGRLRDAGENLQQSGLAGAVAADQADDFASRNSNETSRSAQKSDVRGGSVARSNSAIATGAFMACGEPVAQGD